MPLLEEKALITDNYFEKYLLSAFPSPVSGKAYSSDY